MPTLHDRFAAVVDVNPDRLAVAVGETRMTFGELARRSDRLAQGLGVLGVRCGDRVALIADHHVDAVAAFWGVLKCGAAIVQLNPKMGHDALASVLAECAPAVVLASEAHLNAAKALLADDDVLHGLSDPALWPEPALLPETSATASIDAGASDDLAAIIYTSGSTGVPKGVCLSHRNLWTVVGAVIDDLRITPDDSYLMAVPLHYVHGVMQLLIHHLAGAAVHLARDFAFPQQIVRALEATGVTGFSGVPFHFNSLIENSNFLQADLPALRWLTVTGGRLDGERIQTIRKARPEVDFLVAYGQTECAPRATALSPKRIDSKPNSVGSAIRGVRVLILDEHGHERPEGEIGEVVVEGPNVMAGYWRQPEATKEVIDQQGRLHTGDVGYLDTDGDLFLVGRKSQMIKSAGERIFPQEIEKVLTSAKDVLEAVVVGVPDPMLGERVEAHVRLDPMAEGRSKKALIDQLRRRCLGQMPLARAPKRFHLWLEFPARDNGKVDALRLAKGEGGKPFRDDGEANSATLSA
ncbi:MAG: acyl--CoA ligase [Alphaproteobacteria bacterium]|nr:acyl--CoA ligase [Alphaproteobacteria bacterium]